MIDGVFGIVGPLALAWAAGYVATRGLGDPRLRRLTWAGLIARLAGSVAYLVLHETMYGGGDYSVYLADAFGALGDPGTGLQRSIVDAYALDWSGTAATSVVAWWIAEVVGRSPVGLFLVYATLNFVGAASFGAAFRRTFPEVDPVSYYRWLMLFPSLWFWSSALGKDALVMAGLGIAVIGFVGRTHRQWVLVVVGLAVTFAIRPPYAVVGASALAIGALVGQNRRGTELQWIVGTALILVGAYLAFPIVNDALGFEVTDLAVATERLDNRAEASSYGGSSFEPSANPVVALVTALFRPFPWESSSLLVLISSVEVVALWLLVYRRRRAVARFWRDHWRSEYTVISAAFVVALSLVLGLAVANFGTLVRQRVHLYPFLFVLTSAYPVRAYVTSAVRSRASRNRPEAAAAGL